MKAPFLVLGAVLGALPALDASDDRALARPVYPGSRLDRAADGRVSQLPAAMGGVVDGFRLSALGFGLWPDPRPLT